MASQLSKDECEVVVYQRDFQHDEVSRALKIVEQFIKQRKRILVGGMAIDMSLRTKGKSLYPKDKFPDFDLYSPEFHRDAYMLGNQLAENFEGISVIRAYHISTMKVRINFQELADITYIPPNVYERLPTITHNGFRMIHPHFQMADQHRALSLPYEKPPQETIFSRWKKDLQRYDILSTEFPVNRSAQDISGGAKSSSKPGNHTRTSSKSGNPVQTSSKKTSADHAQTSSKSGNPAQTSSKKTSVDHVIELPIALLEGQCLGGITAGIYWQMLAAHYGRPPKLALGHLAFDKLKASALKCKVPRGHRATIITDDYKQMQTICPATWGVPIYQHATLDKIRRRIIYPAADVELIDNYGNLLGATPRDIQFLGPGPAFHVANLQDTCCTLLTEAALEPDSDKKSILLQEYVELIDIVRWAAAAYKNRSELATDRYAQFLPTIEVFGVANIYDSYVLQVDLQLGMVLGTERNYMVPRDAYPTSTAKVPESYFEFDPTTVDLYASDGRTVEEFDWHLKKTQQAIVADAPSNGDTGNEDSSEDDSYDEDDSDDN